METIGHEYRNADGLICKGPVKLLGVTYTMNNDGNQVELYNGPDAASGRLIHAFKDVAEQSKTHLFPGGIPCESGVSIKVSSADKVTVYYKAYPGVAELEAE